MKEEGKDNRAGRTRQFIIEAVAPIFNKKGYAATSIADLTKATGLTKGGIYGNFANKDEVALACFEYNSSLIADNIIKFVKAQPTYQGKLKAFPAVYREHYGELMGIGGCPLVNTAAEAEDLLPELRQKAAEMIETWRGTLVHIINRGQEGGEFKSNVDPAGFAQVMIALIEGGGIMAKATGDDGFFFSSLNQVDELIEGICA